MTYGYLRIEETGVEINPAQATEIAAWGAPYTVTADDCDAAKRVLDGPNEGAIRNFFIGSAPDWGQVWWHDGTDASKEFLGCLITKVEGLDGNHVTRTPSAYFGGLGGGTLGPLNASHRTLKFTAMMFAQTCAGMDHGMRALTSALRGNGTDLYTIEVWNCCPDVSAPFNVSADGRYKIVNAGVVRGPVEVDRPTDTCTFQIVEFEIGSESPWLYQPEDATLDPYTVGFLFDPDGSGSCPNSWQICDWLWNYRIVGGKVDGSPTGETAMNVGLVAGGKDLNATVIVKLDENETIIWPIALWGADDTIPLENEPTLAQFDVVGVPAGHTLWIDSVREQIYLENDTTKVRSDGGRYISLNTEGQEEGQMSFEFITANLLNKFIMVQAYPCSTDEAAGVTFDPRFREL